VPSKGRVTWPGCAVSECCGHCRPCRRPEDLGEGNVLSAQAAEGTYAQHIAAHYQAAERIELVQDNLNTHTTGSFYKHLPAEAAFALSRRFSMHYTPKKASWLNMAEIEISVLVRQCLGRRIESQQRLIQAIGQLVKERNAAQARVTWQFTPHAAREKLRRTIKRCAPKTNLTHQ